MAKTFIESNYVANLHQWENVDTKKCVLLFPESFSGQIFAPISITLMNRTEIT